MICAFSHFSVFCDLRILMIWSFFTVFCVIGLRPYCIIKGEWLYVWWFLPSLTASPNHTIRMSTFQMTGRFTGRRYNFIHPFSPLWTGFFFCYFQFWLLLQMSGRLHRVDICILTLVLPSVSIMYLFCFFVLTFQMTGRFTGEYNLVLSFSPLWTETSPIFCPY